MDVLLTQAPRFLAAIWTTIWLFAVIAFIATAAGMILALWGEKQDSRFGRALTVATWILRGLPELVVLLFCFLALPKAGLDLGSNGSAILAFSLVGAAFITEIFRASLRSIDPRLTEAARALGFSRMLILRRVVIPLMFRRALTPWATYLAGAVKMLSLASAISVGEVMMVTRQSLAISTDPMTLILFAGFVYASIASLVMLAETLAQRRLNRRGPQLTEGA